MNSQYHARSLVLLSVLLLAVACSSGSEPTKITSDDQNRTISPALSIPCDANAAKPWDTEWLPAVSSDGSLIAAALSTEDGARGNTNLKLLVLNTADSTVAYEKIIIDPNSSWDCASESKTRAQNRLEDANAWLSDRSWNPMMHLTKPDDGDLAWQPGLDGPVVAWNEPDLTIYGLEMGHLLRAQQSFPSWLPKTGRLEPDDEELCYQPSYLGDAWINAAKGTALIRLYFTGNDMCWEHDSRIYAFKIDPTNTPGTSCSALGGQCAPECKPNDLNPQDDACKVAGGTCCVPQTALVPCARIGGTCAAADTCPLNTPASSQPGCKADTVCCLSQGKSAPAAAPPKPKEE